MKPFHVNIEQESIKNKNYRDIIYTGKHLQVVLMSLLPGEEIGNEVHSLVDQFFRIEKGAARFFIQGEEHFTAKQGDAVVVPAGTWHNVFNPSKKVMLKLYTIYSPPNHKPGLIQSKKPREKACPM